MAGRAPLVLRRQIRYPDVIVASVRIEFVGPDDGTIRNEEQPATVGRERRIAVTVLTRKREYSRSRPRGSAPVPFDQREKPTAVGNCDGEHHEPTVWRKRRGECALVNEVEVAEGNCWLRRTTAQLRASRRQCGDCERQSERKLMCGHVAWR